MVAVKKNGKCLSCGTTRCTQWHPVSPDIEQYIDLSKWTPPRKKQVCHVCRVRLHGNKPIVKRSTIRAAGNGLFADRDYKWGEVITMYTGKVYSSRGDVPPKSNYVLFRGGFWIDGRTSFGTGLGRYINGTRGGRKPNVYFGYTKLGLEVPIKVLTKSMAKKKGISTQGEFGLLKNQEIFISYGCGYWKRNK